MHTQKPTVSKRKTYAVPGAGVVAFIGAEGRVSVSGISRTSLSIIRIIKGR
jgi:hypothetical protein